MTAPVPLNMIGDPDAASCVDGVCAIPVAETDADRPFSTE